MNEQYIKSIWRAFPINEQIHISDLYSLFQIHYDKDYEFAGETHNFWECLYVMDGEVCVSADERVYNLKSGEIIFHKPLELHKFTVTSNGGVDVLIFSFSAEGVRQHIVVGANCILFSAVIPTRLCRIGMHGRLLPVQPQIVVALFDKQKFCF